MSQTLALLTTARRARITRPPFSSRTPTARPWSVTISSTGWPRANLPPNLRTPRASASMMA